MELETQQLIIKILGITTILGELGTLTLIYTNTTIDIAIITALITFISGITGGLIGYIGSTQPKHNTPRKETEPLTDQEILQIIEDLDNTEEKQ